MEHREPVLNHSVRHYLALFTAIVLLLDNLTTIIAVSRGAVESNPIIALMLGNSIVYALFTAFKVSLGYYLTYKYVNDKVSLAAWAVVLFFFLRAVVINVMNAW